jgi:hypothetical protein
MELVSLVRTLLRRRKLLLLGVVLAAAVAALLVVHARAAPPTPAAGAAIVRVLVDRPHSLITDSDSDGADTALVRAHVIADQLATDDARMTIARHAAVPAAQLLVKGPHVGAVTVGSPLSVDGAEVATALPATDLVSVEVALQSPILTIQTWAPTTAAARALADSSLVALHGLAATTAAQGPGAVVISQLGPAATVEIPGSSSTHLKKAVGGAVVFLALWCFALLSLDSIRRGWRGLAAPATGP